VPWKKDPEFQLFKKKSDIGAENRAEEKGGIWPAWGEARAL